MARLETEGFASSVSFLKHGRVKFGSPGESVSLLVVNRAICSLM